MHDAPVIGRLLALLGWLAWQVGRPFRGSRVPAVVVALLLLVLAAVPIILPQLDAQPQDVTVQEVFDGAVTEPTGWVRLTGRVVPLTDSPTGLPGRFALLVDELDTFRAIVLRADDAVEAAASTTVTGRLEVAGVVVTEILPIEATVAGTSPRVVPDRVVLLDDAPLAERTVLWPVSILPVVPAALFLIGSRVGCPIFRPTTEIDVLTGPLGPGERLPAAYGGRIGQDVRQLTDPGSTLLLVRRGPTGNLLTAQVLADEGNAAPQPVTIGGSWTSGRVGHVYTVSETVPALVVRSELVDATFLFARTPERDRVAALINVER